MQKQDSPFSSKILLVRRIFIICLILFGFVSLLQAGGLKDKGDENDKEESKSYKVDRKVERLMESHDFLDSYALLCKQPALASHEANLNFIKGKCLYMTGFKAEALTYLEDAWEADPEVNNELPLFLARAYHTHSYFQKAHSLYENAVAGEIGSDLEIERWKEECKNGMSIEKYYTLTRLYNLGDEINSRFSEYGAIMNPDRQGISFVARKPREEDAGLFPQTQNLFYESEIQEDAYFMNRSGENWEEANLFAKELISWRNDAVLHFDRKGRTVYFYKDSNGGDIYLSKKNLGKWQKGKSMPGNINSGYRETSMHMKTHGKTIIFTSDRPGGFGGLDLYMSNQNVMGEWSEPINLGERINTSFNEESPHFSIDGNTLYFASKGHNSIGGYDVFVSSLQEDETWSKPKNMGFPVNSGGDDAFYIEGKFGREFFVSSERANGFGRFDLYQGKIGRVQHDMIVDGNVVDKLSGKPLDARVEFYGNSNNQLLDIVRTTNSNEFFERHFKTPGMVSIVVSQAGYEPFEAILDPLKFAQGERIHLEIALTPDPLYKKSLKQNTRDLRNHTYSNAGNLCKHGLSYDDKINNLYFDYDRAALRKSSKKILDELLEVLLNNPEFKLEVHGHTDFEGSHSYNERLSFRRAAKATKYLQKKGISLRRILTKGYGETKPGATNSNTDGKQFNRRVEFRIIEQ